VKSRPLRLLAFSHSANFGGSEQLLLQLVRELVCDRDTACTVVVPAEGRLTEALRSADLDVWIWPTSWWCESGPVDPEKARRALAAGALEVLRNLGDARSFDPDAVLSITTVIPWGGLAAALLGKPHLWYITDFGGMSRFPPEYYVPFDEVREALRDGTDRLFVVSNAVRERLFPDAEKPPPVVSPHLPSPPPALDGWSGPRSGAIRLTVFGNVRPTKGQWDAAAALAELSRRNLEAELILVGYAGREAEELQEHARELGVADQLRVVGVVPDQHPWMAESDIVLVPSHEETFSLVCLEAQLHAKPLVATRVGGIVEFVHDGVNGLTVPPGDPLALASAVERLIREPGLARRLGEAARNLAIQRFTAEGFSGRVRRMLDDIVPRGARLVTPAPLLAPLEALAAELQQVRQALDELRAQLARAHEERKHAQGEVATLRAERLRTEGEAAALRAELSAESRRRQSTEEKARKLAEGHARITSTRAWRLVQAYWRLANRLRR
jgi:glycosyltransferase involved in cell wall biosynthesis